MIFKETEGEGKISLVCDCRLDAVYLLSVICAQVMFVSTAKLTMAQHKRRSACVLNYERDFFRSSVMTSMRNSSIKTGKSFLRRHHLLAQEKIASMLYLEEYHRYRQDYLSQDRRHQLLADHPLLICSDQYAERCSPPVRSTSVADTLNHHYQALFFLVKMSSLNRVSENE